MINCIRKLGCKKFFLFCFVNFFSLIRYFRCKYDLKHQQLWLCSLDMFSGEIYFLLLKPQIQTQPAIIAEKKLCGGVYFWFLISIIPHFLAPLEWFFCIYFCQPGKLKLYWCLEFWKQLDYYLDCLLVSNKIVLVYLWNVNFSILNNFHG